MTAPLPLDPERLYLTDGGLETTLIFHEGIDLPCFAAFDLLKDDAGQAVLADYYRRYADLAVAGGFGFIFESPTWRASRDWGAALGYDADRIAAFNSSAVGMMAALRREYDDQAMLVSGNLGPRGDGYVAGKRMGVDEARRYHRHQVQALARAGADIVTAITLTNVAEAIGIVLAAQDEDIPAVIGFTTETDGRLPSGATLREAVLAVDAATGDGPAWYMVNCAHVEHFSGALDSGAEWTRRVCAVRANASRLSHAELDACEELDDGDPEEFGTLYGRLAERLPTLRVFGGCCGTDHRHVAAAGAAIC